MKSPAKFMVYKNLQEIVEPEHTALVVWDVQNALVNSAFNKSEFLQNLKLFVESAQRNNVPVVYSKITPLPLSYESSFRTYMQMKRYGVDDPAKLPTFLRPGSPEAEIHSEVSPKDGDLILPKHTTSIFVGTHFEYLMRNRGISTIIFTGIATEIGIDSSARDSACRGFYTVIAEDCVSSSDEEMHKAALKTLSRVCIIAPSTGIIKAWNPI